MKGFVLTVTILILFLAIDLFARDEIREFEPVNMASLLEYSTRYDGIEISTFGFLDVNFPISFLYENEKALLGKNKKKAIAVPIEYVTEEMCISTGYRVNLLGLFTPYKKVSKSTSDFISLKFSNVAQVRFKGVVYPKHEIKSDSIISTLTKLVKKRGEKTLNENANLKKCWSLIVP